MAISGWMAALPMLKLSSTGGASSPPVSMAFKPETSLKANSLERSYDGDREMGLRVMGSSNLGSLRGGTGLLERPTFDLSQFDPLPEAQEGGDIGSSRDKKGLRSGDSYKFLLIDDVRHTEQLVEKALPKVVPSLSVNDARKLFHESRQKGFAIVIVTVKEHAEFYVQMMLRCGLRSAIEPDSNMA